MSGTYSKLCDSSGGELFSQLDKEGILVEKSAWLVTILISLILLKFKLIWSNLFNEIPSKVAHCNL